MPLALAEVDKTNVVASNVLKNNFLVTFFIMSTPIGFDVMWIQIHTLLWRH